MGLPSRVDTIRSQVYIRPTNVSPRHLALSGSIFPSLPADELFPAFTRNLLSNRTQQQVFAGLLRGPSWVAQAVIDAKVTSLRRELVGVINIGRSQFKGGKFQVKIAVPSRAHKEAATQTLRSILGSKPAAYLYTYRKLLARLGAVFLGTATLIGIVSFRNTSEVSVVTAVPTQTEVIQAAKSEAAVASEPKTEPITDPSIPTAPLIGDFGFSLGSPDQSVKTLPSIKAKEPRTAPEPEAVPSPALPAVAEAPKPAPEPTVARKEFVEISVQLTVEDGRVAGAQIGNRQPGAEAFEATALHIARQRRYPPGTSRTETVVVRVANQFERKEP